MLKTLSIALALTALVTGCKSVGGGSASSRLQSASFEPDREAYELARKFAPHIFFHKDEKYFPIGMDDFARNTRVVRNGQEVASSVLEAGDLSWDPDNTYVQTREPLKSPTATQDFMRGVDPRNGKPPMLVSTYRVNDQTLAIQYMAFFAWNDGKSVCYNLAPLGYCLGTRVMMGNHVGDWESLTVLVRDQQMVALIIGAHEGRTIITDMSKIRMIETHPYIYSALGSHGMYAAQGDVAYQSIPTGDKLVDKMGEGIAWFSWDNMVFVLGNEGWARYRGHWGNEHMGKTACQLTPLTVIDTLRKGVNPIANLFGKSVETTEQVCERLGLNKDYELSSGPWWQSWDKDNDFVKKNY